MRNLLRVSVAALTVSVGLTLASSAAARVRSSSQSALPNNVALGDLDGDGIAEWIGVRLDVGVGFTISAAPTNAAGGIDAPLVSRQNNGADHVEKIVVGHFTSPYSDTACVFWSRLGAHEVSCFDVDYYYSPWFLSMARTVDAEITASTMGRQWVVGDFDGDAVDDLFTYYGDDWTGDLVMWRFDPMAGFAPRGDFDLLSIHQMVDRVNGALPRNFQMVAGQFESGLPDSLLAWNSDAVLIRLDPRGTPGYRYFVNAYAESNALWFGPASPVGVLDADGDGVDDFSVDFTGFYRAVPAPASSPVKYFYAPLAVSSGTIPYVRGSSLAWAKNHAIPGESAANRKREDAIVYDPVADTYTRYEAQTTCYSVRSPFGGTITRCTPTYFTGASFTTAALYGALGL